MHSVAARGLGLSTSIAICISELTTPLTIIRWTINSVLSLPVLLTSKPWLDSLNLVLISVDHPSLMKICKHGLTPHPEMIWLHWKEVISSMIVQARCKSVNWSPDMSTAVEVSSCIKALMSAESMVEQENSIAKAITKKSECTCKQIKISRKTNLCSNEVMANLKMTWLFTSVSAVQIVPCVVCRNSDSNNFSGYVQRVKLFQKLMKTCVCCNCNTMFAPDLQTVRCVHSWPTRYDMTPAVTSKKDFPADIVLYDSRWVLGLLNAKKKTWCPTHSSWWASADRAAATYKNAWI